MTSPIADAGSVEATEETATALGAPAKAPRLPERARLPAGMFPNGEQAISAYLNELLSWRPDSLLVGSRIATFGVIALIALSFSAALGISLVIDPHPGFRLQEWFRGGLALSGLAVGGSVRGTYEDDQENAFHITGMPLLLTGLFLLAVATFARKSVTLARARSLHRGQVAATAAVAFAIIHSGVASAARGPLGSAASRDNLNGVDLDAFSWRGLLGGALLVGATAYFALPAVTATDGSSMAEGLRSELRRAVRHSVGQAIGLIAVAAGATVLYYFIKVDGAVDQMTDGKFWVVVLLTFPSLVLAAASLLSGATFDGGFLLRGVFEPGTGALAGGAANDVWGSLLGVALVSLLVGLRHAYREPPGTTRFARIWLTLATAVSCWFVISRLVNLSGSTENGLDVAFSSLDIGTPSVLVLGAFWTGFGLLLGRLTARPLAASFPRTARRLTGKRGDSMWLELFDERRHGLRSGKGTRLGPGRPLTTVSVAVLTVVVLLLLVPSDGLQGRGNAISAAFARNLAIPSESAPAERQKRWSGQEAEIVSLRANAARASSAAQPARRAVAAVEGIDAQIAVTSGELAGQQEALSSAQADLDSEQPTVTSLEDDVSTARQEYNQFSAYDTDGFWLGRLNDAKAALAEGRAPLDAALQARASARQTISQSSATLTKLRLKQGSAHSLAARQSDTIRAADEAERVMTDAQSSLDTDKAAWVSEIADRREQAAKANDIAHDARQHGATRLAPASFLLLALLVFAVTRSRNRRRESTPTILQPQNVEDVS